MGPTLIIFDLWSLQSFPLFINRRHSFDNKLYRLEYFTIQSKLPDTGLMAIAESNNRKAISRSKMVDLSIVIIPIYFFWPADLLFPCTNLSELKLYFVLQFK